VTAQKREESVENVPIRIIALSGADLAQRGIESISDLQVSLPGVVMDSFAATMQPFMRGIGTDITSTDAEGGVAVYQDGAPLVFLEGIDQNFLGLERMEAVYGPQGTLFGRNAVGGAISLVTQTPTDEFQARASTTFGNYARKDISGFVSGPVTSKLDIGFYMLATERNTFLTKYDGDQIGNPAWNQKSDPNPAEATLTGRVKAVYTASDDLKLTGSFEHLYTQSFEALALRQGQPNAYGFVVFGAPTVVEPYVYESNEPTWLREDTNRAIVRVDADHVLGNRLVSITSYQTLREDHNNEADGTSAVFLGAPASYDYHAVTQELQLLSATDSKIQWIVGAFGSRVNGRLAPIGTDLEFYDPRQYQDIHAAINKVSAAVFAQATIPLVDTVNLILGGRYTYDQATYYNAGVTAGVYDGAVLSETGYPNEHADWSKFTPKVELDYRALNTLWYATYSQGYKAGQFNTHSPSSPGPVNPEDLDAYEIGSKSDLLDNRLRVNSSAFYYNYKNLQVQSLLQSGEVSNPVAILTNAAAAKIYGVDLSLDAKLSRDFTFGVASEWLHSEYTQFPGYPAQISAPTGNTTVFTNEAGNQIQRAPKFTTSLNLGYNHSLEGIGGRLNADVIWYYNSGYPWDASNLYSQPAYRILNATVGYTDPSQHWTVKLWGTNLTNQYYAEINYRYSLGNFVQDAPPRMFGVTLSYDF